MIFFYEHGDSANICGYVSGTERTFQWKFYVKVAHEAMYFNCLWFLGLIHFVNILEQHFQNSCFSIYLSMLILYIDCEGHLYEVISKYTRTVLYGL
jgi:hypothetical protein